jgi:hypothetical protein
MDQQTNVFVKLKIRRERQLHCYRFVPGLVLLVHGV